MLVGCNELKIFHSKEVLHVLLILALDRVVLETDFEIGLGLELAACSCFVGFKIRYSFGVCCTIVRHFLTNRCRLIFIFDDICGFVHVVELFAASCVRRCALGSVVVIRCGVTLEYLSDV